MAPLPPVPSPLPPPLEPPPPHRPPTFHQVQLTAVLTAIYQRNQAQSKRSNEAAAWQAAFAGVRTEAATPATWPDAAALDAAFEW